MLVQITVRIDGREAGLVEQELRGSAAELEEQLREGLQRTGRIVLERAFLQLSEQVAAPHCCGQRLKNCGFRPVTVRTTCGDVPVCRRRYRCQRCGHECYPADALLWCGRHRITKPLAQRACQLATTEHFPRLPGLLLDQHGVTLGHDTLMELVHDVGGHLERLRLAEAARERVRPALIRPIVTPARVYVMLDGIMYCTNQTEPHPDDPEQSRLVWQQMKVGTVAWQDEQGRWHKRTTWGRESPREFGAALSRLARRCGYDQASERIFAADGADWCWDVQATFFAEATPIVDWYHVSEHVWEAARIVAPRDAKTWVHQALDSLRSSGGAALVAWLEGERKPRRGQARAALDDLLNYVRPRVSRMDYPRYRARGWQIGTGLIESTCNQLVGQRLKGPGMHWTEAGALAITALKAAQLNDEWQTTWNSLALVA